MEYLTFECNNKLIARLWKTHLNFYLNKNIHTIIGVNEVLNHAIILIPYDSIPYWDEFVNNIGNKYHCHEGYMTLINPMLQLTEYKNYNWTFL